jgi:cytochrome P450
MGSARPDRRGRPEELPMPTTDHPHFPFPAPDPLVPPPAYARLRAQAPVAKVTLPSGDPAWLITRHADVKKVLADRRFSRAAITAPGAPRVLPIARGSKSLFVLDPPEHTRLRRLVSQAFSARTITALRPELTKLTGRLLDDLSAAGPPGDLMSGLAVPLPIMVICRLLGVPYEDVGKFREWTDGMLDFQGRPPEAVVAARDRLAAYLAELIADKRVRPGDDLLTELVDARDEDDSLSDEELLAFGYTLLGAGYHATTATLAHAVLLLLRSRERYEWLCAEPAAIPGAVQELLRCAQAGGGVGALRIAVEDVDVAGVRIRAGEAVLPSINAANFDEAVFPAAGELDLTRTENPHVTFGYGIHHCIGAQLGRAELEVALGALVARFPGLRLAVPADRVTFGEGAAFRRPAELPLTW